jgi:hypothetical protein
MPFDAPVTTATLLDNLLIFTIVLDRCELLFAGTKNLDLCYTHSLSEDRMAAAGAILTAIFSHAADSSGLKAD